jgi:hypothetical protein
MKQLEVDKDIVDERQVSRNALNTLMPLPHRCKDYANFEGIPN